MSIGDGYGPGLVPNIRYSIFKAREGLTANEGILLWGSSIVRNLQSGSSLPCVLEEIYI